LDSQILIQACKDGDPRSQRLLYEQCFPVIMKVASRYMQNQDDAQDIVNRSFLKVLNHLHNLQDQNAFFGWVKQIAVRTAIDVLRSNKNYLQNNKLYLDNDNGEYIYASELASNMPDGFDTKEIFNLIQNLPSIMREVVNLVMIDGYSHNDAAEQLGITEKNSRQYLSRGRKILQEKWLQMHKYYSPTNEHRAAQ
jgi:RNA polymerase sigma factor (sigma-70 family)